MSDHANFMYNSTGGGPRILEDTRMAVARLDNKA